MYARTLFRGAKTCKIGERGCVFGHCDQLWKGRLTNKKTACKKAYLGSIFIMISSLKCKWPPGVFSGVKIIFRFFFFFIQFPYNWRLCSGPIQVVSK